MIVLGTRPVDDQTAILAGIPCTLEQWQALPDRLVEYAAITLHARAWALEWRDRDKRFTPTHLAMQFVPAYRMLFVYVDEHTLVWDWRFTALIESSLGD